ncbi:MAG: hypothetical protein ACR2PL_24120 [Dehalococcoidia bacterium]
MPEVLKRSADLIVEHHPRSPNASPEALARLAGVLSLKGPVPSWKFLEDEAAGDRRMRA